jgi:hypothetical protein
MELRERVFLESAPRIDADKGVLFGVKLLGSNSRNNRRYSNEAMESAAPRYSGKKIYVDHPGDTAERSIDRWAGTIQNARFQDDGIYGDIKLRKESGFFKGILEAAQDFPKDIGFSHVADGKTRFDGDTEVVESIKEVFSVDLVTDPATTSGIFESLQKPKTLKTAIESLPDGPVRKRLVEMIGGGMLDGELSFGDEKEPADPLAQMSSLCKELIGMLGETLKALASKKETPAPEADPLAPTDPPEAEAPEDEMKPAEEKPADPNQEADEQKFAFESVKRENAELKARTLLLESGREATDVRVKALASADEADRAALLESWPKTQEAVRPASSPPLVESVDFDLSTPGSFAARYR